VLGYAQIGEHGKMPVCKEKSCPHRIRFGKNLKGLRNRQKLTQEVVAEKIGASTRYIQNLEAGNNFAALPVLIRLKQVLDCSWDELFDRCERAAK
jgi:transcriptional regulator with XRE-family HTH domain